MKVIPAMVMVPVRRDALGFAWKLKPIVPPPFPGVPEVTVIQAAFEVADQAHPVGAVTFTDPVPAAATTLAVVLDRLNEQDAAA